MKTFLLSGRTALVMGCLALIGLASAQMRYKVYDSGVDFNPTRIGQAGMIAGQAHGSFAYDRLGGLSSIPPFSGWQIWAEDVNAEGLVVGSGLKNGLYTAFIWDRGSGTRQLADFNGDASRAFGINDFGMVVGNFGEDFRTAFVWLPEEGWITLPAKYGGQCGAYKINNSGEVLGYTQINQTTTNVIWRLDGTIVDMGVPFGQNQNFATDLNNGGYVSGDSVGSMGTIGYLWAPNGTYTAIHNPYSPGAYLDATGLNDSNVITGALIINGVGWKGYIRYPNGTIKLLNSLLDSSSQEWDVREAWDINNKGQISAAAYKNGQRRGVLLQPIKDRTPISIGGIGR